VTVTNYLPHPFEVIAKGASAGTDIILLAMGGRTGPFESDTEVAWIDNGSGTVTFTLTSGLYDAMIDSSHVPGYRCGIHVFTMRGNFDVLAEPKPLDDPIPEPIGKGTISIELETIASGLTAPVYMTHVDDGITVIGGFVYHGSAIPELNGKYVFGDFSTSFVLAEGRLLYADLGTGLIQEFIIGIDDRKLGLYVKALGQDSAGELYLLAGTNLDPFGSGGKILKIVDLCTTRIPGDINNDCEVNFADFAIMAGHWLENAVRQSNK